MQKGETGKKEVECSLVSLQSLVRMMDLYTTGYTVCKIYDQSERLLGAMCQNLYIQNSVFTYMRIQILCRICIVSRRKTSLLAMVKQEVFPQIPTSYFKAAHLSAV